MLAFFTVLMARITAAYIPYNTDVGFLRIKQSYIDIDHWRHVWLLFGLLLGSITGGIAVLIDYLWPLWDEENRALHDYVVNTRTVLI